MNANITTKRLIYVFEDDAPLPKSRRRRLANGLFLAPLPSWLLSLDNDYHLLAIKPNFSRFFRDHLHRSTLNVEYEGRSDLNVEGVQSEEQRSYQKLDWYLLAAMLHSPSFVPPYASFVVISTDRRICHSHRMKDFAPAISEPKALKRSDFNRIEQLFVVIAGLLSNGQPGRLPTALRYYQQAFRTDIHWSVRFLGMMMAMESLFSHGASEVSHQVSERTSFFLRASGSAREALYERVRDHYKLRSSIAHGGAPSKSASEVTQAFEDLLLILQASLVKVLSDERLTSIFSSASNTQFGKALQALVFSGRVQVSD